jgi:hypothetical protein
MSCLPGTPCYTSTIHTTGGTAGGCNLDPCNTIKLGSDAVFYIGPTLPCSGINPCDNISLALQKIDAVICNPPALSVTANNGLTKTANNIQLGGELIQQTVITTSFANTLSLLGLSTDTNPAFILSQTSSGVIRKTTIASIISGISANNGISISGGIIQLSGPLIKPTTVTTDAVNTLTLAGLQTDANPDFIVTETTAGVVRRISTASLGAILGTPITANNGLTKTGNNIELGGTLIKNTNVNMNGFTFTLADYTDPSIYSFLIGNKSVQYLQAGDQIAVTPTGSVTRTIVFKSSAATWLTNYTSSAYNAQANWEAAHPWVVMDSLHNFQVVDYIHSVNRTSAFLAHYYDERVGNANWQETWYSSAEYTADTGLATLKSGDYFTIANYDPADDFSPSVDSIYSGTINTNGCVFIANGTAPIWTASKIEGDFPVVDFDTRSAFVITRAESGIGRVNTRSKVLYGEHDYISIGNNSIPTQKWGVAVGTNNTLAGGGENGFAAGALNTLSSGSSSYAIGESNTIANGNSGALGFSISNQGTRSHAIGYDLDIPSANTGTLQVGSYNNIGAVDYLLEFGVSSYPTFSVGNGTQSGVDPAEKLNIFHVMKSGFVKSKDGHDARAGQRGMLPPQWTDSGWVATGGQTFDGGAKYIITQYETGDDFSNLVDRPLWGQPNTTGYTFIAGPGTSATDWSHGSEVVKVGRPTSPEPGEMGYNLDAARLEYWNGSLWVQL